MVPWLMLLLKLLACWSLSAASEGWSSQNVRSLPNWPVQKAYWESQSSMSKAPVPFKEVGSNLNEQTSWVSQQKVQEAPSNHDGFVWFGKVPPKASRSDRLMPPSRPGLQAGISFDLQKVGSRRAPPKLSFSSPSRPGSFSPVPGVSGSVSGALSLSVPTRRGTPYVKLGPFPGSNSRNFPSKSLYQMPARVSSLGSQGNAVQLPLLNFKVPASSTSPQKTIGSWFPPKWSSREPNLFDQSLQSASKELLVSSGSSRQVSSALGGSGSWSLQSQSAPSLSQPIAASSLSKFSPFPPFSQVLGNDRGFESLRPDFGYRRTVSELPWSGASAERHGKSHSEVKTPTYSQFGWSTGDNPSDTVSFLQSLGVPSQLSSAELDPVQNPAPPASPWSTKVQVGPYGGPASGQPVPATWFQSPSWLPNRIQSSTGSSTAAKVPPSRPSTPAFPGWSALSLKQLGQKFLSVVPSRQEVVPQTSWLPAGLFSPQRGPLSRFFPQTASDGGKRASPGRLGADQLSDLKGALKFQSSNPPRQLTSLAGRDSIALQGFSQSGALPLKQASVKVDLKPNFSNRLLSGGLKAVMSRKSGSSSSQRFASPGFYYSSVQSA